MREHGGDIDAAIARFGGAAGDWIDLSTGINRLPYPVPPISGHALTALPTRADTARAIGAARTAYGVAPTAACLAVAGAQAAIQLVPRLRRAGRAAILSPTYNEHAAAFRAAGWKVEEPREAEALAGADAAVVVNPNNPDGRRHAPGELRALAGRVGLLVVDESFADVAPELSLCPHAGRPGLVVLRSFGKFHGLAGIRLGFVIAAEAEIARIAAAAGPWAVSGPALEIGASALADPAWAASTRERLAAGAARLDRLAGGTGWSALGGTTLFRLYETGDAVAAQARLARHRIWSRSFPWSRGLLRLGLPGPDPEWARLAAALGAERRARDGGA